MGDEPETFPKVEEIRIHVTKADMTDGVNLDGSKGKKCNNCGGYGYTLALKGGRIDCTHCDKTGVEKLSLETLEKRVFDIEENLAALREIIIKSIPQEAKP